MAAHLSALPFPDCCLSALPVPSLLRIQNVGAGTGIIMHKEAAHAQRHIVRHAPENDAARLCTYRKAGVGAVSGASCDLEVSTGSEG